MNIKKLRNGTNVVVRTMNSVYYLEVTDAAERQVEVTGEVMYNGTANVMNECIEIDLPLLLITWPGELFVRTSLVQEVVVE